MTAPELSTEERAIVDRFDAAEAAPESWHEGIEQVAALFHATYERLAPEFGYRTRKASAVAWEDVPAENRALMVATCREVLDAVFPRRYMTGLPS